MAVNITFTCDGVTLSETNALDFGTVQAGTSSAIKTISVANTGTSDAQQCVIEAKEATIANGFSINSQSGTTAETCNAQKYSNDSTNGSWYAYAVFGVGKSYASKTGGTIIASTGTDSCVTKWEPPSNGTSGQKVWGNVFSCVYI